MISYLNGGIIVKKEKFIILDVNGVGYKVFLSKKSMTEIPKLGSQLKLFCYLNVKETIMDLYGFLDYKQLEFFETLESIRGVGPKIALEISALGSLDDIKAKILSKTEREFVFDGIPGIGKKKAMTIILELTGKIKEVPEKHSKEDETEEGLVNLGFPRPKIKEILKNVSKSISAEERIQQALKILGNEKNN